MTAPLGSSERGLVYQWVLFGMAELEGPLFRWIRELGEGITDSPAGQRFADAATAIEAALRGGGWLLGERFSAADVLCASILAGAHERQLLERWPGLSAYVERSEARPAYARAAAIWGRPRS